MSNSYCVYLSCGNDEICLGNFEDICDGYFSMSNRHHLEDFLSDIADDLNSSEESEATLLLEIR